MHKCGRVVLADIGIEAMGDWFEIGPPVPPPLGPLAAVVGMGHGLRQQVVHLALERAVAFGTPDLAAAHRHGDPADRHDAGTLPAKTWLIGDEDPGGDGAGG